MNSKVNLFSLILILFTFISCKPEGRVYENHKDLSPEIEWKKEDARTFEVPVEDKSIGYDLSIGLRYAQGYPWNACRILVKETSPSGKERKYQHTLKVRADNGDYIGEPGYDIWDSTHLVEKNKKYEEEGVYTYTIQHDMPKDPLPYVMEIGIIVDKAK